MVGGLQATASAESACRASHQLSATTATPGGSPALLPASCTTARTPGCPMAASRSKRAGVAPSTGDIATAAYFIPGSRTSMP